MSRHVLLSIGVVLAITLCLGTAGAQEKPGAREREALRRSQQQMQQIRQEKTTLEEKLAGFEKEKIALKEEKDKLAAQVSGALARAKSETVRGQQTQVAVDALTQENQGLLSQKTELEKRVAELAGKLNLTEKELAFNQSDKKQTLSTLTTRDQQLTSCENKNVSLYQHGRDLIEHCRDRSATDAVLRLERFTGIKRVEIENLLEEYRDRLDAQKIIPEVK